MSYDTDIVRAMWYETVSSGMSGVIVPPPNGTIVTELWRDSSSVLTSTIVNDVPNFRTPLTSGGTLVGATLDVDGNYVLLNEPASYPIALLFIYEIAHQDFDKDHALFGRVYQGSIGLHELYKTNAHSFTLGPEYIAPVEDNHAVPKKYVDDKIVPADQVEVEEIGTATYDDVQDFINLMSSGRSTGGAITDNEDGSITVAAGTGYIHSEDIEDYSTLYAFDWAENDSVELTNNSANYIYIDYNDGTPQILATDDRDTIRITDQFILGRVYREDTTLNILESTGFKISNYLRKEHERLIAVRKFERASGSVISEIGTRNIAITAGVWYLGHNKTAVGAKDTSDADKFTYWYILNGAWTAVTDQTQIDNQQYNDVSTPDSEVLADLSNNKYGVNWVYLDYEGNLHVVYGQDDYTLTAANSATTPASLPDKLDAFGAIVGKIIIEEDAATFESVETAYEQFFPVATAAQHNELGGLQGGTTDEYYHLLAAEYTELSEWLDNVTLGSDGLTSIPEMVLVPRAAALSDVQGGMYYSSVDGSVYVCTSAT